MTDNQGVAPEGEGPITQYSGNFLVRLPERDLSIHQVERALRDEKRVVRYDPERQGLLILGQTPDENTLLIVASEERASEGRPIWRLLTARYATPGEVRAYREASRREPEP